MTVKSVLIAVGKVLLGALAFFIGSMAGSIVGSMVGLPMPTIPAGMDASQAAMTLPVTGLLVAATLAVVSHGLGVRYLSRWLILGVLAWVAYGLNTYLETTIVMPSSASSLVVAMSFGASFACAAVIAWLFPPAGAVAVPGARTTAFFSGRSAGEWAWRLVAALLAFPAAYLVFGNMVLPFVGQYYTQQFAGLVAPTWSQLLPVLFLRSLLFLLSLIPVLIAWNGSRTRLFWVLSGVLFMLVGGVYLSQSAWLPVIMRVAHSIEILADSLVHAAAVVFLLVQAKPAVQTRPALEKI